jgi:glycosyltransferase involved in cell wall biosynthesis
MKIGLFSDTYHPSTNGIVYVIDILHANLEALGHEVVIVAPRPGLRTKHAPRIPGKKVIWIPGFEGIFFDEYLTSVFSPTRVVRKLDKQGFDAIVFFTPGQVGLLGSYVAKRNKIPLIEQYSTDLVEYVGKYPGVMAGVLALSMSAPFVLKMRLQDIAAITKKLLSIKRPDQSTWSQETVRKMLTTLHNHTDLVVAVSPKTASSLKKDGVTTKVAIIPTGVDRLPSSRRGIQAFRKKWHIAKDEQVVLYAGRLGEEKNLDMLIDAFALVARANRACKLMMVGDFGYREKLELRVKRKKLEKRVIFTGRLPRPSLGNVYAAADIFVFPSLTDTQGLVLNEAAHASLPFVWCDKHVNEVVVDGINGFLAKNDPKDFADALLLLLSDTDTQNSFSSHSQRLASKFTEQKMTHLLDQELNRLVSRRG